MNQQVAPARPPAPLRSAANHDSIGSYHPVVVLDNSVTDPGETLKGEVFFSGYGSILHPKLLIQGPGHVFSAEKSTWRQGFEVVKGSGRDKIVFAGRPQPGFGFGVVHLSALVRLNGIPTVDMFSDITPGTHKIFSEDRVGKAPLSFELSIQKKCRPGTYELAFVFTYFNGEAWVTVNEKAPFTVRNVLQRLDWKVATFALIAAGISLTADFSNAVENLMATPSAVLRVALGILQWSFPPLFN